MNEILCPTCKHFFYKKTTYDCIGDGDITVFSRCLLHEGVLGMTYECSHYEQRPAKPETERLK